MLMYSSLSIINKAFPIWLKIPLPLTSIQNLPLSLHYTSTTFRHFFIFLSYFIFLLYLNFFIFFIISAIVEHIYEKYIGFVFILTKFSVLKMSIKLCQTTHSFTFFPNILCFVCTSNSWDWTLKRLKSKIT